MELFSQIISILFDAALFGAFVLSSMYLVATLIVLIFCRKQEHLPEVASDDLLPYVTVQLPTRNEAAVLNCAQCCLDFDYPKDRYEIMIGDDSNQSDVSAKIDEFAARTGVRVSRRPTNEGYKAGNLNTMNALSKGEYILVLDSDFVPTPDFLRRLVRPVVADPDLAAVQARWHINNAHTNLTTLFGAGIIDTIHMIMQPFLKNILKGSFLCGSGMLIKKAELDKINGWSTEALTEDVDCALRIMEGGGHIHYLPDLVVDGETPYRVLDLYKQQMRWAYGVTNACFTHLPRIVSAKIMFRRKLAMIIFSGGYLMSGLLLLNLIFGTLNCWANAMMTHDVFNEHSVAANWVGVRNFFLTCGMLATSIYAGFLKGNGKRHLLKLFIASFTLGTAMLLWVGRGLFLAIFKLPLEWHAPRKSADEVIMAAPLIEE
jgi:cellulose synthase/poly-beta-1,6-N-acetylglucosamine synthase-like glycosyltransferase